MVHDPGGRVALPLQDGVSGDALFDGEDNQYRYALWRWEGKDRIPMELSVAFIMMNPSVADDERDDPSVRKCWSYATRWGFRSMVVLNTFAYRATAPRRLLEVVDPVGPHNDEWIERIARATRTVVCAWGTPGSTLLHGRGVEVEGLLRDARPNLHVLRLSQRGRPVHPLYLPLSLQPLPWPGGAA